jgi:hypothetical protein
VSVLELVGVLASYAGNDVIYVETPLWHQVALLFLVPANAVMTLHALAKWVDRVQTSIALRRMSL